MCCHGRPRGFTVTDSRASSVPVSKTMLSKTTYTKRGANAGYTAPHARKHHITWARVCFNPFSASRPFPPVPPAPAEEKSKLPSFSSRNLGSLRASFPRLTDTELVRPVSRDRVGIGGRERETVKLCLLLTRVGQPYRAEPCQCSHAGDDDQKGLIVILLYSGHPGLDDRLCVNTRGYLCVARHLPSACGMTLFFPTKQSQRQCMQTPSALTISGARCR